MTNETITYNYAPVETGSGNYDFRPAPDLRTAFYDPSRFMIDQGPALAARRDLIAEDEERSRQMYLDGPSLAARRDLIAEGKERSRQMYLDRQRDFLIK